MAAVNGTSARVPNLATAKELSGLAVHSLFANTNKLAVEFTVDQDAVFITRQASERTCTICFASTTAPFYSTTVVRALLWRFGRLCDFSGWGWV